MTAYDRGGSPFPWLGWLHLRGWHGVSRVRVRVVGTTAKSWRIEALERTKLPSRVLELGERAIVPHAAVTADEGPELPQLELDFRQTELPFARRESGCSDCDRARLEGFEHCGRHVAGGEGKHQTLQRLETQALCQRGEHSECEDGPRGLRCKLCGAELCSVSDQPSDAGCASDGEATPSSQTGRRQELASAPESGSSRSALRAQ